MLNSLTGVTILLSLTVFLNMVSATMPVTSDNPLLGKVSCFLSRRKTKKQLQPFERAAFQNKTNKMFVVQITTLTVSPLTLEVNANRWHFCFTGWALISTHTTTKHTTTSQTHHLKTFHVYFNPFENHH